MIDTPKITRSEEQLTAAIRLTVPRAEIRTVMGPGLAEVRAAVEAQGIAVTGPWFTHHFRMDPEVFDFEICLPVEGKVTPVWRVKPGRQKTVTVARTVYHGGYEGLGSAWGEFNTWLEKNGHTPAPDIWECYLSGPETEKDPAAWRTELSRPLR